MKKVKPTTRLPRVTVFKIGTDEPIWRFRPVSTERLAENRRRLATIPLLRSPMAAAGCAIKMDDGTKGTVVGIGRLGGGQNWYIDVQIPSVKKKPAAKKGGKGGKGERGNTTRSGFVPPGADASGPTTPQPTPAQNAGDN